jgi:hypothetical protein
VFFFFFIKKPLPPTTPVTNSTLYYDPVSDFARYGSRAAYSLF